MITETDNEGNEGENSLRPDREPRPSNQAPITDHTFLSAGRAIFSIQLPSGRHFTYRVVKGDECTDGKTRWFVGLLTKPDNYTGYTYMGMYDPVVGQLFSTTRSKLNEQNKCWMVFEAMLDWLHRGIPLEPGMELWHCGKCGRCARLLTDPESVREGIGPECRGKMVRGKVEVGG